jgi:hypothetical protein
VQGIFGETMNNTEVRWIAPGPLWDRVADAGTATSFNRPSILRFASDNLMNEFTTLLQTHPTKLKDFRVHRETWRGPATAPTVEPIDRLPKLFQKVYRARMLAQKSALLPAMQIAANAPQPLKLYQPAHQRFYLITAGLVCQIAGQPDRHIETGNQERVTFVVRKVVPPVGTSITQIDPETWKEYAFVNNSWLELQANEFRRLAASEEQNPLFAMTYLHDDNHRRRVLAGLVPVGKREAYISAPQKTKEQELVLEPNQDPPHDPRALLFMANVTEPWKRLIERAFAIRKTQKPTLFRTDSTLNDDEDLSGNALYKSLKESREQIQTTSWYVLLDFVKLLRQYIPNVWETVMGKPVSTSLGDAQSNLVETLTQTEISEDLEDALVEPRYPNNRSVVPATIILNLRDALRRFETALPFNDTSPLTGGTIEQNLESLVTPYDRNPVGGTTAWPDFLFPLADPEMGGPLPINPIPLIEDEVQLTAALDQIDALADMIEQALPEQPASSVTPPLIASQPVMGIGAPTYFVIRCVFERPNCGPLQPNVVSEPTEPFIMAGFFDPDAPARPLRINLPVDTTPAGLRKFDKNTAFMISNVLCGQIERAKGLGLGDLIRTVLPWPLHKDLDLPDKGPCDTGMICSLSIPIITICALILLMIIVALLDIIFRWMPFFIMCLPLPKFDAKQATT